MTANQSDAIHKAWMYRILTEITEDPILVSQLRFKGGTCAAMRKFLERFSIDLDFDLVDENRVDEVRMCLEIIFKKIGLTIKDQSKKIPQYFLIYPTSEKGNVRKTLKLDMSFPAPKNNTYEPVRLTAIERIIQCQTIKTMFANKLTAPLGRFKKRKTVAGRDIFDIHSFFLQGFKYDPAIIKEITGKPPIKFLQELRKFIKDHVTQTHIDQDLNTLLPPETFKRIRKYIKQETLAFIGDEIERLKQKR